MHERYGVDLADRDLLTRRSWRWLRVRLAGLMAVESRLHNALRPPDQSTGGKGDAQGR